MTVRAAGRYDPLLARVCDALTGVAVFAFLLAAAQLQTAFALAFVGATILLQLLRP